MDNEDKDTELPTLTEKQMNFVLGLQKRLTQTDAYKQAYNCEGSSIRAIWTSASRLASNPKVKLWLAAIKVEQITQATYTLEAHLADMAEIKELAIANGNLSAATKACENLGKACDHYTTHIETTTTRKADLDLLDQIETQLGKQARTQAERKLGMH